MPSGNKILGYIYNWYNSRYINLDIYISPRTITQGLCGSFDGNSANDIFNRFTNSTADAFNVKQISASTSASWRFVLPWCHTHWCGVLRERHFELLRVICIKFGIELRQPYELPMQFSELTCCFVSKLHFEAKNCTIFMRTVLVLGRNNIALVRPRHIFRVLESLLDILYIAYNSDTIDQHCLRWCINICITSI